MISWSLLYILSEWLIRLAMVPVVVRRRGPSVAMGWLLVIFFQPWIGLVLYVLIGENRLPVRRAKRHAHAIGEVVADGRFVVPQPHIVQPPIDPDQQSVVTLAEHLGEMPIIGGNAMEMLAETAQVIDRLVADIDSATDHVHLLFYIFEDDETGRRVTEALERAVKRGVQCRVMVDAVGSWRMARSLGPRMRAAGVELQIMLPVNPLRRKLARLDLRNHRKIAIIDGRVGYTGSQNLVDPTYGHKHLVWYDVMIRVSGPIVLQLQTVFVQDWFYETSVDLHGPRVFPEPGVTGDVPIQALPSGPTYPTESYQRLVVAAIYAAKRRVVITSPYLVPDQPLLQALQVAVMRGVRVQMIVPATSDQHLVAAAGRAYYAELMEMGVEIYAHREGLLHAKTMTVDDVLALIGSGNFDIRSFYLNFELNMLLYGPAVTGELRFIQDHYIRQSDRLTLEQWNRRPRIRKVAEDVAKLLSPLL